MAQHGRCDNCGEFKQIRPVEKGVEGRHMCFPCRMNLGMNAIGFAGDIMARETIKRRSEQEQKLRELLVR